MKRKIIFGFLMVVLLLFFITSSWALDYKRAKYRERPDQECTKVPVTPETMNTYPSMIKFIFVPTAQNLPVFIFIGKSSNQTPVKAEGSVKNSIRSVNKTK